MAMNPKLKEGSILLYYPDIQEKRRWTSYSRGSELYAYELTINALYVYNRRERTSGANVPRELQPYLESLKVRVNYSYYSSQGKYVTAVGCRSKTLYTTEIPINANVPNAFRESFKNIKAITNFSPTFFENEFVEKFLETNLANKDKKFVLFTPIERLQGFYPIKDLKEIEHDEVWSESKKYKLRQ